MKQQIIGFSMIELLIVIAIIALLATIALPAYVTYQNRAKFVEIIEAVAVVRKAVDICFQTRGRQQLAQCNSLNKVGVIATNISQSPWLANISINKTAEITAIAINSGGFNSESYTLTPIQQGNILQWQLTSNSSCITQGYC